MIAVDSAAYMQSLINAGKLFTKRVRADDPIAIVDQQAVAQETKAELAELLEKSDLRDGSSSPTTPKPGRKLTRRQLKHREAMVRFRQRKKAKIAVLEEEELKLQNELNEKLREYKRRQARMPPSVDDLLGMTDRATMLQRAFVQAVMQIEGILDENEALEEALAVHDKFHGTLKRVRERIVETSVWKCV